MIARLIKDVLLFCIGIFLICIVLTGYSLVFGVLLAFSIRSLSTSSFLFIIHSGLYAHILFAYFCIAFYSKDGILNLNILYQN